jgi:hypothetical protein
MGDNKGVQGEGNYDAAREYDEQTSEHAADKERVKQEAEAAKKALEGEEGEELRKAEEEGKARARE